ncbi:T-cell receptor alpha chain V region HPB-MLT [Myotis brandtii]|nr:T-cell receptor alpha chain V region HPB-MLT [Myotis brandtii]
MNIQFIFTSLLALALSGSGVAQKVTQPQPEMSVQEAETATLACTYDTSESNYYLFWYKQPPSGEMIFIIRQEAFKKQNQKIALSTSRKQPKTSASGSQTASWRMLQCISVFSMRHSEMCDRERPTETSDLSACVKEWGCTCLTGT